MTIPTPTPPQGDPLASDPLASDSLASDPVAEFLAQGVLLLAEPPTADLLAHLLDALDAADAADAERVDPALN